MAAGVSPERPAECHRGLLLLRYVNALGVPVRHLVLAGCCASGPRFQAVGSRRSDDPGRHAFTRVRRLEPPHAQVPPEDLEEMAEGEPRRESAWYGGHTHCSLGARVSPRGCRLPRSAGSAYDRKSWRTWRNFSYCRCSPGT